MLYDDAISLPDVTHLFQRGWLNKTMMTGRVMNDRRHRGRHLWLEKQTSDVARKMRFIVNG